MATDDVPPPLEDMTATLEQAKKLRGLRLGAQENPTGACSNSTGPKPAKNAPKEPSPASAAPVPQSQTQASTTSTSEAAKSSKSTPSKPSGSGDFGGMRKGFLFGGPKSSGASSGNQQKGSGSKKTDSGKGDPQSQAESIPFIKPKTEDKNSGLKLDEVQAAMESTKGFLQDKEWVTDDLLEKVQKNETLGKRLGDPRFMQAVTEFQTDPKAAMTKYQDSPEMQQFLKEFCGILGDHFSSLGDKQDSQTQPGTQKPANTTHSGPRITELTDEDSSASVRSQQSNVPVDPHVQQILADPANREILMDPKVQQLIQHLRNDPEKAQRLLREGDSDFRQKIDRLISLGLLKFQG